MQALEASPCWHSSLGHGFIMINMSSFSINFQGWVWVFRTVYSNVQHTDDARAVLWETSSMHMVTGATTLGPLDMRTKNVLWFGYTLVPETHVLRAWSPGSGTIEGWLAHKDADIVHGTIHQQIHSQMHQIVGVGWLEALVHYRHATEEYFTSVPPPHHQLPHEHFSAAIRWTLLLHHTPWYSASSWAQKWSSQPTMDWNFWNPEPRGTHSWLSCFSRCFVIVKETYWVQ